MINNKVNWNERTNERADERMICVTWAIKKIIIFLIACFDKLNAKRILWHFFAFRFDVFFEIRNENGILRSCKWCLNMQKKVSNWFRVLEKAIHEEAVCDLVAAAAKKTASMQMNVCVICDG